MMRNDQFYQHRLGTNIGTVEGKACSAGSSLSLICAHIHFKPPDSTEIEIGTETHMQTLPKISSRDRLRAWIRVGKQCVQLASVLRTGSVHMPLAALPVAALSRSVSAAKPCGERDPEKSQGAEDCTLKSAR